MCFDHNCISGHTPIDADFRAIFIVTMHVEVRNIAISVSVRLSVCPSVHWHISKTTCSNLTKFSFLYVLQSISLYHRRRAAELLIALSIS